MVRLTPMQSPSHVNNDLCLAAHVRACAHGGQVILLDLRRERYVGVAGARFAALASAVSGWPEPDGMSHAESLPQADIEALAAPLLRQGLLTRSSPAQNATPVLPEATRSLNAEEVIYSAPVDAVRVLRFVRSSTSATLCLRLRSLQAIANRVAARRRRAPAMANRPAIHPLRTAVAAYLRLRPLMLTAQDRCLHDSLSLLGFLAAEGWFPNWVIGVTTQPFRAHAWVQAGDLVLSDLHENVRRYTPILVA